MWDFVRAQTGLCYGDLKGYYIQLAYVYVNSSNPRSFLIAVYVP